MLCKVCIRCKQFVYIESGYEGQVAVSDFEHEHKNHPLVNMDETEINEFNDKNQIFKNIHSYVLAA
jgi:hypothetical protein